MTDQPQAPTNARRIGIDALAAFYQNAAERQAEAEAAKAAA